MGRENAPGGSVAAGGSCLARGREVSVATAFIAGVATRFWIYDDGAQNGETQNGRTQDSRTLDSRAQGDRREGDPTDERAGTGRSELPTIVAIHGFRGDHHGLEPIVERLAGYRLIVPDLPGFGDSAPFLDRKHDVAGYADWLIGFVSLVRGQGPLVLLGHSFGSIIVSAAIARGLDADRVVLINPIGTSVLHGPRALLTRLAVSYYRIAAAAPERIGQALLASRPIVRGMSMVMAKTHDQSMRRWIHDQHRRYFSAYANRQVVVEAFAASTTHDVSEYAGQIPIPILLIIAERDDITRVDDQYRLAHQLTSAEVVLLRRVGHLIHYEAPAAAAAAIIAFLERGDHL